MANPPLRIALGVDDALDGPPSRPASQPLIAVGGSAGRNVTARLLASVFGGACDATAGAQAEQPTIVAASPEAEAEPSWTPRIACLTNLRCDGLDSAGRRRWGSVALHRASVVRSLGSLARRTTLVVNADDSDCVAAASRHPGRLLTFGEDPSADIVATPLESTPGHQAFLIDWEGQTAAVSINTPGSAFRANCMAAIASGLAAGLDLPECVRGVERAAAPSGMLEPVVRGQSFPVVFDRATRPIALRSALEAARPAGGGRLLAVVRLADDARVAEAQIAAATGRADRVLCGGGTIVEGQDESVTQIDDRVAAIAVAIGLADEGDAVLIAGCGAEVLAAEKRVAEQLLQRRLSCDDRAAAA